MAAQAGVAVNDTFGLLARYGRDVAGALVIGEEPPDPARFDAIPYSDEGLAEAIDELPEHPLGAHDDSELSLAGLQDKLLLVELPNGGWARPVHGRPSTHILKVDDLRFPGLIAAEAHGRVLLTATTIADIAREAHTWGRPAARAATVAGDLVEQMLAAIDQQVVPRDSSHTPRRQAHAQRHRRRVSYSITDRSRRRPASAFGAT